MLFLTAKAVAKTCSKHCSVQLSQLSPASFECYRHMTLTAVRHFFLTTTMLPAYYENSSGTTNNAVLFSFKSPVKKKLCHNLSSASHGNDRLVFYDDPLEKGQKLKATRKKVQGVPYSQGFASALAPRKVVKLTFLILS
jgi:hypothetical protein